MKVIQIVSILVIFSLCSQVNAIQPTHISSNFQKEDKPIKNRSSLTQIDLTTIKSANNALIKSKAIGLATKHTKILNLTIIQPSNNTSVNRDTFQIIGNSSSNSYIPLVSWSIDNSPTWTAMGTTNWSFTASSLSEGIHNIHVNTIDVKGNTISKSIKITVDIKPPMLTVTSPISGDSLDHISSINGTASDDNSVSSVKVIVDDQDIYKAKYTKGFWSAPVKLYAGTHVIKSIAIDKAGNSAISRDVYFSLSNPKPPIPFEHIPYAWTGPIATSIDEINQENSTQNVQTPTSTEPISNAEPVNNNNQSLQNSNSHSQNSNSHSQNSNSHSQNSNSHSQNSNSHK